MNSSANRDARLKKSHRADPAISAGQTRTKLRLIAVVYAAQVLTSQGRRCPYTYLIFL
jgi:hypothetical protein